MSNDNLNCQRDSTVFLASYSDCFDCFNIEEDDEEIHIEIRTKNSCKFSLVSKDQKVIESIKHQIQHPEEEITKNTLIINWMNLYHQFPVVLSMNLNQVKMNKYLCVRSLFYFLFKIKIRR
jgi:hypothetical protein